ncbi:unnamed protein product [Caenorhabditis angaria]|uniref:G-protein coupled receptors family 1 profile domain-containing protein n=1 Tax=Caenorhabditis angaria TaxID=860376 RepID=A0A9P1IYT2_9PELO|nr:unnamed protein product [Caenorhabditis angaria]
MYKVYLKISRYISIFGFISTVFFNTLLIILTGWYLKQQFGTYKHLIIIFSIIGLVFNILGFIFQPMLLSFKSGFMSFLNIETWLFTPNQLTNLLYAYGASLYISSSFLAVMFIHRYYSVAKPEQLFHFQQKRITLWVSYSLFIGAILCFSASQFCQVDEFSKIYFSEEMVKMFGKGVGEIGANSVIIFDDFGIRWKNVMFLIVSSIIINIQNLIIFYCGRKIRRKLYSKNIIYSPALLKLHKQFFKTLLFQVLTPTVLLFIPTLLVFFLPFFELQHSFPSGIVVCLYELYPPIDSIIVMYVITDYRAAIKVHVIMIYRLVFFFLAFVFTTSGQIFGGYTQQLVYQPTVVSRPVYYQPHQPVVYHQPMVYHQPVVYHQPMVYHQPVVYHQPTVTYQAYHQPLVYSSYYKKKRA